MISHENSESYALFLIYLFNIFNSVKFDFANVNIENSPLSLYFYKYKSINLKFNIINSSLKICTNRFFALPL